MREVHGAKSQLWSAGLQEDIRAGDGFPPLGRAEAAPGCSGSSQLPRFAQGTQHSVPDTNARGTAAFAFLGDAWLQLKKKN